MANRLKILMVDDHHLMIEGMKSSLQEYETYEMFVSNNCDDAFDQLKKAAQDQPFDVLFTDLSFDNTTKTTNLVGGEDLIKAIRAEGIDVKIAVVTGHTETNRVYNVITNLSPDAYILKSDCSGDELHFAIQKIMKGDTFYSHEIHQKIMNRNIIQIQMDEVALQILRELPNQNKIINLEGLILKSDGKPMKIRAIENKLANLRIDLNANNNTDLVLKAKELGIID